jgi:hypothetical protein
MNMWFSNSERRESSKLIGCLLLNTEEFTIETPLRDEITIFRARKQWRMLLKEQMMLEENRDFKLVTLRLGAGNVVSLHCMFQTSFGRYAFWRLASMQANELVDGLLDPFKNRQGTERPATKAGRSVPSVGPTILGLHNFGMHSGSSESEGRKQRSWRKIFRFLFRRN